MKPIDVKEDAAVIGRAEIIIEAPLEVVWGVLTDFELWPEWNSSVSKMALHGGLKVGTEFTWVAAGSRIRSRLEEVDAPRRVVWSGKTMGIHAIHVWEFETVDGATRVRTRESFDGLPVRLFPRWMARTLDKALHQALADLKTEVASASLPVSQSAC